MAKSSSSGSGYISPSTSGAVPVRPDQQPGRGPDGADALLTPSAAPGPHYRAGSSPPGDILGGADAVELQLQRLESRLLAEAGGDPVAQWAVRRHLADSCARFAAARVRQFVPILVEREVRERLRAEDRPVERRTRLADDVRAGETGRFHGPGPARQR